MGNYLSLTIGAGLVLALAACTEPSELPKPGAEGPVEVWYWADSASAAVSLRAAGATLSEHQQLLLDEVVVHIPLERGWLSLRAQHGVWNQGIDDSLSFGNAEERVDICGVIDGLPLWGSSAHIDMSRDHELVSASDCDLSHGGMAMTTPTLQIRPGHRVEMVSSRRREDLAMILLQSAQPDQDDLPNIHVSP